MTPLDKGEAAKEAKKAKKAEKARESAGGVPDAAPVPAERTPARPRLGSPPNPYPGASPLPSPRGGGGSLNIN